MEIPSQLRKKYYTRVDVEKHIEEYKLYGNSRRKFYVQYEKEELTPYQNALYLRAMNGLGAYKPEEITKMHPKKKEFIQRTHTRVQRMINIWKQEVTNELTNKLFDAIWTGKNHVIKEGIGTKARLIDSTRNFVDPNKKNKLSFKALGLKKEHIVNKLINEGFLPKNFYELKPKT